MQTAVTVVNLIHDTATETDRPVCWVFPGCSWRECRSTSGSGTAKDPERTTHVRIPASVCTMGYLPYAQWAALSAAEKTKHWTCLLYTSPSPRDAHESRMPSSA